MKSISLSLTLAASTSTVVCSFTTQTLSHFAVHQSGTALSMGLFDGVKDAFSAPAASSIDSERETPIDRWMGWNVKPVDETPSAVAKPGEFSVYCVVSYMRK